MANRLVHEPAYPQSQAELEAYCERLIEALHRELGGRLTCVLLCGSWARGEATHPRAMPTSR
jgi:predicted nucleotidyltransferase